MKHLVEDGGGLALGLERAEGDRAGGFASGLVGEGLAVLLGDGARQAGGAFPGGAAFLGNERYDPERDEASEQRGESPTAGEEKSETQHGQASLRESCPSLVMSGRAKLSGSDPAGQR